jgi:hypothetical protein
MNLTSSAWPGWQPLQPAPFWEALDKAKTEAFMILPAFEPSWWPPLAGSFMSALRRKLKITILSDLPMEENKDYAGQIIRELRLYGANVVLAEGFSDLLVIIDDHHLSLGFPANSSGHKRWPFLSSYELPKAAPLISALLQSQTLHDKLGPGGLHSCPLCGWPFVLVNPGKPRDFAFRQSLRLGCLNPSCSTHKRPRRLDERWPFPTAPVCKREGVPYVLKVTRRSRSWVCPKHGAQCPTYRYVPGDCPSCQPQTDFSDRE